VNGLLELWRFTGDQQLTGHQERDPTNGVCSHDRWNVGWQPISDRGVSDTRIVRVTELGKKEKEDRLGEGEAEHEVGNRRNDYRWFVLVQYMLPS
jgi:hypothetical protein